MKSTTVNWGENKPGELNYYQFYESFKHLPYDLTPNDMRMLLAIADENPNGFITVKDFIPVGIEAIKTFLHRNKLMAKQKIYTKEINPETIKLVYMNNAAFGKKYLTRKLHKFDTDPETKEHKGFVTF